MAVTMQTVKTAKYRGKKGSHDVRWDDQVTGFGLRADGRVRRGMEGDYSSPVSSRTRKRASSTALGRGSGKTIVVVPPVVGVAARA